MNYFALNFNTNHCEGKEYSFKTDGMDELVVYLYSENYFVFKIYHVFCS